MGLVMLTETKLRKKQLSSFDNVSSSIFEICIVFKIKLVFRKLIKSLPFNVMLLLFFTSESSNLINVFCEVGLFGFWWGE